MSHKFTRRKFLKGMGIGAAGWIASQHFGAFASAGPLGSLLQDVTLTYWVNLGNNAAPVMTNFNEMGVYQELERITGVHIDFQHAALGQAEEQFNLLVASGQYPDIIEHNWLTAPGGPAKYLADSVIIRLNELLEQHAPNLSAILEEHPDWRREVVTDEGDLYCFPFLRGDPFLKVFKGPIVRKDWLDTLGLEVPTTIDEWHDMLVAFKEGDPNGNGEADELPFTTVDGGRPLDGFRASHAFVGAWGIPMEFYQVDGVVSYGMIQPEFKEFLATIAQWYSEGLIDPDFVITDVALMDAKVTGNQLGSFVGNTGGSIGKYMGLMRDDPTFNLVAAPYPVLNKGDVPQLGQQDNTFTGIGAAVTTSSTRVEEAVRWLDFSYSPEGQMLFNFGIEGVSYNLVDGYPTYSDEVMNSELPLQQSMSRYGRASFNGPFVQDRRYMEQYAALPQQQESLEIWTQPTNEKRMPPVTPTQDESRQFASIMNDINTLRDEAMTRVIIGQMPVADWNGVVDQMRQIGIEDAITIQQAALERFNNR